MELAFSYLPLTLNSLQRSSTRLVLPTPIGPSTAIYLGLSMQNLIVVSGKVKQNDLKSQGMIELACN